ncbi:G-type lectin S-receptor-like serine/threonine-protein kinase [Forsythia ovata]|uniref:G-type lectin S-receptor-like serine/threonine-protein kinase n=1 Tax=Forsythia ovata TaxID=205694 RepID=A0ABD1S3E1_9LAMI
MQTPLPKAINHPTLSKQPIDTSGILTITPGGNIIITSTSNQSSIIWTANITSRTVSNPILKILDRGNLVLKNNNNLDNYVWQSFDYPFLRQGSQIEFRSGSWDGVRFGGRLLHQNTVFKPIVVFDSDNLYYAFENSDVSIISRLVVNQSGLIKHLIWSQTHNQWTDIATMQSDSCDDYANCVILGFVAFIIH